jgi:hypothetical protein
MECERCHERACIGCFAEGGSPTRCADDNCEIRKSFMLGSPAHKLLGRLICARKSLVPESRKEGLSSHAIQIDKWYALWRHRMSVRYEPLDCDAVTI